MHTFFKMMYSRYITAMPKTKYNIIKDFKKDTKFKYRHRSSI